MSVSASRLSSDSGGSLPAARPNAPRKPRHHSNSAPLRSASQASSPGSSSANSKLWSSSCAALALAMRSSALPSTIAGNSASTSSLTSQSGPYPPPPASQPDLQSTRLNSSL